MNPWQWIWESQDEAQRSGDYERMRLTQIYLDAHALSYDLPDEKLALFESGRALATQLGEPWWAMFYEHWAIETLLYGKQQPLAALDRVVRAVLEVRKPVYDGFPQRVDLYLNLTGAYLSIDPIGYEGKLREVFVYLEKECADNLDKRAYFAQLQGYFLEAIGDKTAIDVAWGYLQRAEDAESEHFQWDALYLLSSTLYRFEREMARFHLADIAQLGEEIAKREKRNRGIAAFRMWRAVAARWNGDEAGAAKLYERAVEMQKRVPTPRNDIHFAAMAFHREAGEWEDALRIIQQSLRILRSHGLTFLEAQRRFDKCELLAQMGRDWSRDARRLEHVAAKLLSESHWKAKIAQLRATTS
jgi:tetratricopeptide (TPR) repeat protein